MNIKRLNKRPKSKGFYLDSEDLKEVLIDAYFEAINKATLEAFEGIYDVQKLAAMVNQEAIIETALNLILSPEN